MLEYLKQNGIEGVYGEISNVDDVEKVINFWRKNGFTITLYEKREGHFIAKISYNLFKER